MRIFAQVLLGILCGGLFIGMGVSAVKGSDEARDFAAQLGNYRGLHSQRRSPSLLSLNALLGTSASDDNETLRSR